MADGKYSVDDILNEYSGTNTGGGSSDIDIDTIIGGFDLKSEPDLHTETTETTECIFSFLTFATRHIKN